MEETDMDQTIDSHIHSLIIESLPEHIAVMDHTSTIMFVNRAWKIFADQNDLDMEKYGVGHNYIDLCEKATGTGSEEADEIAGQLRKLLSGEIESFSTDYPCHAPDRQRWFRLNGTYFMINNTRWAVVIHENITAIKQASMDLIENENKLKGILASVPDAMLMYDPSLNIVWSNEPARAVFGPDLDHRKCMTAFKKQDRPCDDCLVLKTFADRQVHSGEYTHPNANGTLRTFLCRSSIAGYDQDGNPSLVMEILQDITRRKAAEKENKKLSQAIEYSPVCTVITDVNGTIEYVNPKFTEVTGYTREEALGQNPRILSSRNQPREFYTHLWETIQSGNVWQGEFENLKKNGDFYWESASISPIFNEKQEIIYFVAVKEDITERKKMIRQLETAKTIAESATLAKSNFLATMSHEIRTPMNAILGMSRLALETKLDDTQRRYISNVHNAADALMAVINDILDFSRAEGGQLEILNKEFNFTNVITKIIKVMTFTAEENNLQLSHRFNHTRPLFLIGDPVRLNQIIINLVSNALKYTPAGQVTVTSEITREESDRVFMKISVQDTGIGMTDEQTDSLFEPFSQIDGSSSRKHGGTGLGLAIVKHLISLMEGTIDVSSTPGTGSVFSVTLPFIRSAASQDSFLLSAGNCPDPDRTSDSEPEHLTEVSLSRLKGKKVLVVDDDPANREIIRTFLEKRNIIVHDVPSGEAAVDMITESFFHLVFMDIEMPGMDGYETTGKVRTLSVPWAADLPIIALTGHTLSDVRDKISAAGMNDHLEKPVKQENLFQMMLQWTLPDTTIPGKPTGLEKPDISGLINMKSGLAYVDHNQSLYLKMLKKFSETYSGKDQKLLADFKAGDVQAMRFMLHNLKSIAGMIGAVGLEQDARKLITRLNNPNVPFKTSTNFSDKISAFVERLEQVIAAAHTILDTFCPEKSLLEQQLKTMHELIQKQQPAECRTLLSQIRSMDIHPDVSAHLNAVEKLTDVYRFRDAEEKILELLEKEV